MQPPKDLHIKALTEANKIKNNLLHTILYRLNHALEFDKDFDEFKKKIEYIADKSKWDYAGVLSDDQKARLELLDYLLDDSKTELKKI